MKALATAKQAGAKNAIKNAEAILDRSPAPSEADALERRVNELAEALFQSVGMQLSVEKYQAIEVGRGANLDELNVPLNNRQWLKQRFAEIRKLATDAEALAGIEQLLHWTDPGSGGFYDDLGNPPLQPHLLRTGDYAKDPGFLETPFTGIYSEETWRHSWCTHTDGRYGTPVRMRYTDLDPHANYKLRVVYAGDNVETKVALSAASSKQAGSREFEIHPFQPKPRPVKPIEFEIPHEATSDGTLTLTWRGEPNRGGAGRGCQIAEVWLIKNATNDARR
jgi:hypothetical protein